MKIEVTYTDNIPNLQGRKLILLFAGWGMDADHFRSLSAPGYDIMVCYDYTDGCDIADISTTGISSYSEIVVIGWSFGVPVANRFINRYDHQLPITLTVAVNGTPWPVDNLLGIPEAIFRGTLEGLNERTLEKFRRRMTGSSAALTEFLKREPKRSLDSLYNELKAIEALPKPEHARWDLALISSDDRIIPAEAQLRAWEKAGADDIINIEGSHYPDFQKIIDRHIKNKRLVESRFSRSHTTYDTTATVQREVAARVAHLASEYNGIEDRRILEIGCGTGLLTHMLLSKGHPRSLELWDLIQAPALPDRAIFKACDAETSIAGVAPGSFDTIVTASTVQWFNSLPKFLLYARRAVTPGGLMILSSYGPDTFADINRITGSGLRRTSSGQLAKTAGQCGWTVELAETDLHTLCFDNILQMLRHMQQSGVNGATTGSIADVIALSREYPRNENGRINLVYQPIYLILRNGQKQ